jgi:hypothetical protein
MSRTTSSRRTLSLATSLPLRQYAAQTGLRAVSRCGGRSFWGILYSRGGVGAETDKVPSFQRQDGAGERLTT